MAVPLDERGIRLDHGEFVLAVRGGGHCDSRITRRDFGWTGKRADWKAYQNI